MRIKVRTWYERISESKADLGQSPTDSTGLLWPEVKGSVLLLLVQLAEVLPGLLVHDGHDPRNGLADGVTAWHNLVFFEKRSK